MQKNPGSRNSTRGNAGSMQITKGNTNFRQTNEQREAINVCTSEGRHFI